MVLVSTWPHADARTVTPGMSPALHYSAYSNWSLATYPFFSSSKLSVGQQLVRQKQILEKLLSCNSLFYFFIQMFREIYKEYTKTD